MKSIINLFNPLKLACNNFFRSIDMVTAQYFFPQTQLLGPNYHIDLNNSQEKESSNIFENIIWRMAVPKSKVSPGRKREKHMKFVPENIQWVRCEKCGEPKRSHRICTTHLDICALTPEEYQRYKADKENNPQ